MPGVIAVLTGQDWLADGMKPTPIKTFSWHPAEIPLINTDGSPAFTAPDFPLPHDKARFVGEALAIVVAETVAAAKDGAERVAIDYEPLPCVTFAPDAAKPGAPLLHEHHGSNVCIDALVGDGAATDAAFARAKHIARLKTWVPRVAGSPMEPRAALAEYDAATGKYTLYTCNGSTRRLHGELAATLGVPDDNLRLVIRDVGGNFGTRGQIFAEQPLVAWAARKARPPGEMDVRSQRSLAQRLSGPRPRGGSGARARRRTAISSRCAATTSEISARAPATTRWSRRASRSCRASIACRPRISAPAAC